MNDTMVTVVGNVATQVEYRETVTGGMARFRIAVTPRRWDRQRESWVDGPTGFYTVFAWRALAANLAGSVSVGDPLVVRGRLRVREEERDAQRETADGGGQRRTFVDIEAVTAGHDLARGTSAFRRMVRAAPPPVPESRPGWSPGRPPGWGAPAEEAAMRAGRSGSAPSAPGDGLPEERTGLADPGPGPGAAPGPGPASGPPSMAGPTAASMAGPAPGAALGAASGPAPGAAPGAAPEDEPRAAPDAGPDAGPPSGPGPRPVVAAEAALAAPPF
ncbi:single-stranded DNA-binding protein [Streptomyces katsurahamanus]|uniref:Single-stranded DNA-binding protein n=2 Tax=Streptomyces katsurahamanus TaxID=2577098 RepID=A0ABW9NNE9_9ACTN|nr:single-stranded DNA-binding protein [Streptomyces katsurahamanus]